MLDPQLARAFHHVEGADDVGVDIGARVLEAVAHPGLRGEMDDDVGLFGQHQRCRALVILQHALVQPKSAGSAAASGAAAP